MHLRTRHLRQLPPLPALHGVHRHLHGLRLPLRHRLQHQPRARHRLQLLRHQQHDHTRRGDPHRLALNRGSRDGRLPRRRVRRRRGVQEERRRQDQVPQAPRYRRGGARGVHLRPRPHRQRHAPRGEGVRVPLRHPRELRPELDARDGRRDGARRPGLRDRLQEEGPRVHQGVQHPQEQEDRRQADAGRRPVRVWVGPRGAVPGAGHREHGGEADAEAGGVDRVRARRHGDPEVHPIPVIVQDVRTRRV
mmetsp:Transcript_7491/g.20757  ORF Transcript_7491/g.20757 Transcript_7491/m.20757 type:complete len:249 (-) Transcript_7491:80-826(-)